MLRCIYCGLCVEACLTEAITMTSLFEISIGSRGEAVGDKEVLVGDEEEIPNNHEEQIKLTNCNELKTSDGWMRATSSNVKPKYQKLGSWTG